MNDTIIIGGGMSGLACARRLKAAGLDPLVLDKGRGPGGRMSTRRAEPYQFDHGAQYFTVRDEGFRALIADLEAAGAAAPWRGRFGIWRDGAAQAEETEALRWVGTPGMNALVRALGDGLTIRQGAEVSRIEADEAHWRVTLSDGESLDAAAVILALPAEQARTLSPDPALSEALAAVSSAPCLTAMIAYDQPVELAYDGLKIEGGALSWLARDGSKPQRRGETWVAHAAPGWSQKHLQLDKDSIARALLEEAQAFLGGAAPVYLAGHRWRYALVEQAAGEAFFWDADTRLGACGDGFIAPRVESAWLSGKSLGHKIIEGITCLNR